jgi:hypothetical protein
VLVEDEIFHSPTARGSGAREREREREKNFSVLRRVVVEDEIFQSPTARGSGARSKFFYVPRRVVVGVYV